MKISNPERPDSGPIKIVCTKEDNLAKIFAKLRTYVTKELTKLKPQTQEHDSFVLAWWGDWTLTYTISGELKTAQENDTAPTLCSWADDNNFELARDTDDKKNTGHYGVKTFVWNDLTPDGREAVEQLTTHLALKRKRAQVAAVPTTGSKPARSRHVMASLQKTRDKEAKKKDEPPYFGMAPGIPYTRVFGKGTEPNPVKAKATKPSSTAATMGHVIRTEY